MELAPPQCTEGWLPRPALGSANQGSLGPQMPELLSGKNDNDIKGVCVCVCVCVLVEVSFCGFSLQITHPGGLS